MPETNFFWDPLSGNILQERDESGVVTADYTTEPGLYGNVISQSRDGVESQFHFDAIGSTLAVTDDDQQITDTRAYTAFGEATEQTGSTEFPFQYVGKTGYSRHASSSVYAARRRTYSATDARWQSVDPARESVVVQFSEVSEMHAYVYSANSPINRIDPLGSRSFLLAAAAGEGNRIEVDPDRRCWPREEWQKCKDKGELPPGHDPKDFPEDYPGLPEGFADPLPIWWGTEVARGRDVSDKMPSNEELDSRMGECVCIPPYASASRMRPKGKGGIYPTPGQPAVDCEVGEQVLMKYPAVCKGNNDDPCKGPWNPDCVKKSCSDFVLYECAFRGGATRWINATLPGGRPNTVRTKCK